MPITDRALAVLPAAGWISMNLYTPYVLFYRPISSNTLCRFFLRVGNSLSDPWVQMLMNAAVSDYNDDFYTPHLVGIPLMIRMGSDGKIIYKRKQQDTQPFLTIHADDNVPPYHLRRMARLVDELSNNPHNTQVSEIPGQGHWFNGVVDDPVLQVCQF